MGQSGDAGNIAEVNLVPSASENAATGAGRVPFLGLRFDSINFAAALARVRGRSPGAPFGYVVTPNVDHVVRLLTENDRADVAQAYASAELTLCDSRVLALLARRRGKRLPVASGSDLTAALLDAERGSADCMLLIGGDSGMVEIVRQRFGLTDVRQHIPPMGLLHNPAAIDAAVAFIVANPARYIFLAVGSPQQELIALAALRHGGVTGLGLCIGASIDYLTGRLRRAPALFRVLALEWAFRLACEPSRLWRRYLVRSPRIFLLMRHDERRHD